MGGRVKRSGPAGGTEAHEISVTAVGPVVSTQEPDRLLAGDLLAGRYQIEAAIGVGASGRVLRAFDRETRAVVAVKILRPELVNDSTWVETKLNPGNIPAPMEASYYGPPTPPPSMA